MPNKSAFPVRSPLLPSALILVFLFVALALWPSSLQLLEYRRAAIAGGEWWRLFTGHFVHLNLAHALLNGSGALLLAVVLADELRPREWWIAVLLAPLAISAGLWLRQPGLQGYAGFSGVLHGLLYLGVLRLLPRAPALAGTVLLLLVCRQIWEQTPAYNPDYLQGVIHGRVMPDAHLFGALTGLVLGLFFLRRTRLGKAGVSGYSSGTGPTPDA